MRKLMLVLCSISLSACSTQGQDPSLTASAVAQPIPLESTFYLTSARADAGIANVPGDPTRGLVEVDLTQGTLKLTLVYDLFPFTYNAQLNEASRGLCGEIHYKATIEDRQSFVTEDIFIELVDHRDNVCVDGPDLDAYAYFESTREDTTLKADLYFSTKDPNAPTLCHGSVRHNDIESTEYEVELFYLFDEEGNIRQEANIRIRARELSRITLLPGPWGTLVHLQPAMVSPTIDSHLMEFAAGSLDLFAGADVWPGQLTLNTSSQQVNVSVTCQR